MGHADGRRPGGALRPGPASDVR